MFESSSNPCRLNLIEAVIFVKGAHLGHFHSRWTEVQVLSWLSAVSGACGSSDLLQLLTKDGLLVLASDGARPPPHPPLCLGFSLALCKEHFCHLSSLAISTHSASLSSTPGSLLHPLRFDKVPQFCAFMALLFVPLCYHDLFIDITCLPSMEPYTWLGMETGCSLNCIILSPFAGGLDSKQSAMWETWVRFLGWKDPWRKEWLTSPVFLPGEFHGQRGLAGYSPWGLKRVRQDWATNNNLSPFYWPPNLSVPRVAQTGSDLPAEPQFDEGWTETEPLSTDVLGKRDVLTGFFPEHLRTLGLVSGTN